MMQDSHAAESYTVGWIAALPHERAAATAMLDERHEAPSDFRKNLHDDNQYTWGRMAKHNIVIASLPAGEYGTNVAAVTARSMLSSLTWIRVGLLVGIGAGVPTAENDVRLGDVVVSIPKGTSPGVIQYDLAKAKEGKIRPTGHLDKPPAALRAAVAKLQADVELDDSKIPELLTEMLKQYPKMAKTSRTKPGYVHQGFEEDVFYEAGGIVERAPRDSFDPEVHYGTIASGNMLVKDCRERDAILQRLEGSERPICFEMEAAGLMNNFPCLVVRGICDYADEHKNDMWQKYAAATAAAYAKELLTHVDPAEVHSSARVDEVLGSILDNSTLTLSVTQNLQRKGELSAISSWLKAPDSSTNYSKALIQRHPGTGAWLLDSTHLTTWKEDSNGFLWLYGIPGAGKTVLATILIEHMLEDPRKILVIYFYFDFTEATKQTFDSMIRSLLLQCCSNTEHPAAERVRAAVHGVLTEQSTTVVVASLLSTVLDMAGPVRIVLDALDECTTRPALLEWIEELLNPRTRKSQLLVTSRREPDIVSQLEELAKPGEMLELAQSPVNKDIDSYVRAQVSNPKSKLRRWHSRPDIQREIVDALMGKANGMFRWAACQIEVLQDCRDPPDLREALAALPRTLAGTYDQILLNIPPRQRKKAIRLLQFLVYSERPLRIEEAIDVLAVSLDRNTFSKDDRLPDPREITAYCASLIVINEEVAKEAKEPDDSRISPHDYHCDSDAPDAAHWAKELQLAHFSVKEYFISSEIEPSFRHEMSQSLARSSMAQVLLTYLLNLGSSLSPTQVFEELPLSLYSTLFGLSSAEEVVVQDTRVQELVARVLDHSAMAYRTWLALYDSVYPWITESWMAQKGDTSPAAIRSPLYITSLLGLKSCVSHLLDRGADVEVREGILGGALQAASYAGHKAIVCLLLDRNADINAQGGRHGPALHTAVSRYGNEEVVRLLLSRGADSNPADGDCGSALCLAVSINDTSMICALLDGGADIDALDRKNGPALHYAIREGKRTIVRLLLERGANASILGNNGETALHIACAVGKDGTVHLLVEKGADMNAHWGKHGTPLRIAYLLGEETTARILLDKGADIDAREKAAYKNVLLTDSSQHERAIVRSVLSSGARIQHRFNPPDGPSAPTALNWKVTVPQILLPPDSDNEAGPLSATSSASKGTHGISIVVTSTEDGWT